MNLHEIYKTLMRRGMPKHRDLVWTAFAEPCVACALDGDVAILTTNTAYDLITMHALRWVKTLPAMRVVCQRWQAGWNIFVALDDDYWDGHKPRPDSDKFTGDTILAAILAATEHLEPKGDDDAKHP